MANGYIHIEDRVFSELHLSGNDAILYALVASYCKHDGKYECRIDDIAKRVNISRRNVRYTFDGLAERGFITKERKQYGLEVKLSEEWRSRGAKIAHPDGQKVSHRWAKSVTPDGQNLPISPLCNNLNNNKGNKSGEGEKINYYGIFLEEYTAHFERTHPGQTPASNVSNSTYFEQIHKNLMANMAIKKIPAGAEPYRKFIREWFEKAYKNADQWKKDNWSLKIINEYFDYYNSKVNGNGTDTSTYRPPAASSRLNFTETTGGIESDIV